MQTIKTAAVVVLMLTVLYGGYVSLTTPPEPLPDEIEEFLVIEEAERVPFMNDDSVVGGLPLGTPPAGVLGEETPRAGDPIPEVPAFPVSATTDGSPPRPLTGADVPLPSPTGSSHAGPGHSFADMVPGPGTTGLQPGTNQTAPTKLPEVGANDVPVTPGPADSYASTDQEFQLPDPSAKASTFDPEKGAPFAPDADSTAVAALGGAEAAAPENRGLINAFSIADTMYSKGQLKEALATLSVFYTMPNINAAQRQQLLSRLDPLAREVIYSRRHLLEQPRRVGTNETLQEIAKEYGIPWKLLANINHVEDPVTVLPGTELKVLRGPFRAEVDLTAKQMTLYLGDLYAGRFDIEVGNDPAPQPGSFTIQEKRSEHVFYDQTGLAIPAGSADNPYGNMWLDLGGQVCIHGSPNTVLPTDKGCISVAGDYADDVIGILSQGSSVSIRR